MGERAEALIAEIAAFRAGRAARTAGQSLQDNPFKGGRRGFNSWANGWEFEAGMLPAYVADRYAEKPPA